MNALAPVLVYNTLAGKSFIQKEAKVMTNETDIASSAAVPLTERIERAQTLDLGPIKFKLVHNDDHALGIHTVEKMEEHYKRFLILQLMYPEHRIVPNKDVDAFWHAHILDTTKYAADCDHVFGGFLHHFPYFGLRGKVDAEQLQEAFNESKELYQRTFGEAYGSANADCQVSDCDAPQCNPAECNKGAGLQLARPNWEALVSGQPHLSM